jgi:hypothetical protein
MKIFDRLFAEMVQTSVRYTYHILVFLFATVVYEGRYLSAITPFPFQYQVDGAQKKPAHHYFSPNKCRISNIDALFLNLVFFDNAGSASFDREIRPEASLAIAARTSGLVVM